MGCFAPLTLAESQRSHRRTLNSLGWRKRCDASHLFFKRYLEVVLLVLFTGFYLSVSPFFKLVFNCQFHTFFACFFCLFGCFFPLNNLHPSQLWLWKELHGIFAKLKKWKCKDTLSSDFLGNVWVIKNLLTYLYSILWRKSFLVKLKASCCSAPTHLPGCGDNVEFPGVFQIISGNRFLQE